MGYAARAGALLLLAALAGCASADRSLEDVLPPSRIVTIRLSDPRMDCDKQGYLTSAACWRKGGIWAQENPDSVQTWWRITPLPDGTAYVQSEARLEDGSAKCRSYLAAQSSSGRKCRDGLTMASCCCCFEGELKPPWRSPVGKWRFESTRDGSDRFLLRYADRPRKCATRYLSQLKDNRRCQSAVKLMSSKDRIANLLWIVEPAQPWHPKLVAAHVAGGISPSQRPIALDIEPPAIGRLAVSGYRVLGRAVGVAEDPIIVEGRGMRLPNGLIRMHLGGWRYTAGNRYAVTVYALNGAAASMPSNVVRVETMPAAPVIASGALAPPGGEDPFGAVLLTMDYPLDGGLAFDNFTIACTSEDESVITYVGLGEPLGFYQLAFWVPLSSGTEWPMAGAYSCMAVAANAAGASEPSTPFLVHPSTAAFPGELHISAFSYDPEFDTMQVFFTPANSVAAVEFILTATPAPPEGGGSARRRALATTHRRRLPEDQPIVARGLGDDGPRGTRSLSFAPGEWLRDTLYFVEVQEDDGPEAVVLISPPVEHMVPSQPEADW